MTYADKLRDPRWQRRRLEIFQRDGWRCQFCKATTKTLHVHHREYISGREPWEYADNLLVTACEDCHEDEHCKEDEEVIGSLPFNSSFDYPAPEGYTVRPWQQECMDDFVSRHTASKGQLRYLLSAGVGAGKTPMAAMLAAWCLAHHVVERVVYVCPNVAIMSSAKRWFKKFGIHLVSWDNTKHGRGERPGEPVGAQGVIVTYHAILKNPVSQAELCSYRKTLVVFDEIHHLGDSLGWDLAAKAAFEYGAAVILGLTGTPYRSDGREIPFVLFEGDGDRKKFKADYTYTLGRGIQELHNRQPLFRWQIGDVEICINDNCQLYNWGTVGNVGAVNHLGVRPSEETENRMLNAWVDRNSASRVECVRQALDECRGDKRKLIVFLGGDSSNETNATEDAEQHFPTLLRELGLGRHEYTSITSVSKTNRKKTVEAIESFGSSDAWVLVTVNMISEGADIPSLSAALFLTSVTSQPTTVQRIGRVLRGNGEAWIYMAPHRSYLELAAEIDRDKEYWAREIKKQKSPNVQPSPTRLSIASCGLNARPGGSTFAGSNYFDEDQYAKAVAFCKKHGIQPGERQIGSVLLTMFARL